MLAYEVTRDLPTRTSPSAPRAEIAAPMISGKQQCIVSILRAGNGMLDGMLELLPAARTSATSACIAIPDPRGGQYYFKVPSDIAEGMVIVCDPMLATGNSAVAAINRLKERGVTMVKLVCLLAAPEGVRAMLERHPDVTVTVAALDDHLNDHGYIVPGLGDAGDRIYGTR